MSVAMGTVFLLNAVALYLFPCLGHAAQLCPRASSAPGQVSPSTMSPQWWGGGAYGEEALRIATVVKLSRVLWIVPVTLVAALLFHAG